MRDGTIGQEYVFFSFMLLFLYSPLFIFSIFYFPECPFFLRGEQQQAERGGAGRDRRGRQQQHGKGRGRGTTGTYAVIFLFLFLCFHSFLRFALLCFRLFIFRQVHQQAGHKRKAPAGWDGVYAGGDSNVGRHRGGRRSNGYVFFYFCILSTLLFYSYHSSSFPIISFSVEYNNRRAGRDGPTRAAMTTRDRTGGRQARQVRLLLLFFFLLSSFFFSLLSSLLSQTIETDGAGPSRTGQDGTTQAATAMRDGTGGRRIGEGCRRR